MNEQLQTVQLNIPPGMIDFGIGQPDPALLPLDLVREAAEKRLGGDDASFLAYGAEQGNGYFRSVLAQFLNKQYDIPVDLNDLFITASASQGLDLICTLFSRSGDTIFVEEPSYFLALRIFADHRLNVVSLPMDENGLIIEALEEKLTRYVPAFLYTVPTFHNPSSITLSANRRKQLVQLSLKHNFLVIADEVYHLLAYDAAPPRPMAGYLEHGSVLSVGSFSKIMAPGLRLGWIQAAPKLMDRLISCGLLDSGGGLNPFTSAVVCSAIETGLQQKQLTTLKTTYSQRKTSLGRALRDHLPVSVGFSEPAGGFFFWLRFPDDIDTEQMLAAARKNNVGYVPGIKFSSRKSLKNYARLSFSYFGIPQQKEGVKRLTKSIEQYLADPSAGHY